MRIAALKDSKYLRVASQRYRRCSDDVAPSEPIGGLLPPAGPPTAPISWPGNSGASCAREAEGAHDNKDSEHDAEGRKLNQYTI